MAENREKTPVNGKDPAAGDEAVSKPSVEDLSLESEREALKKAQDAETAAATSGDGSSAHGNLHFGDQERGDIKTVGDDADERDGDPAFADGDSDDDGRDAQAGADDDADRGNEPLTNETSGGAAGEPAGGPGASAEAGAVLARNARQPAPESNSGEAAPTTTAKSAGDRPEDADPDDDRTPVNEAPTDIALSDDVVAENDAGALIATLVASDPDADDTATYSIVEDPSGLFEVVGDELRLRDGVSLDHEAQDSYEITLQVEDSAGNVYTETVTINVADINEGPTGLILSGDSVNENDAGATVAILSATDEDEGDIATFSIAEDPSGLFVIVGDELRLKDGVSLDHEAQDAYQITIEVEDGAGNVYSETVTINVADLNEGPTDLQLSNTSVDENGAGAVVGTLSAFDPDDGDALVYTVSDDRFEIVGDQLRIKEGVSFDHETIDSIDVTVTATDQGGLTTSQSFTIDVNDLNERPTDIALSGDTVDENDAGATVAILSATDEDEGDIATFSIAEDPSGLFEIVGDELRLKDGVSLDHEAQDAYQITIEVEDSGGATYLETVTINVADLNEGPTDIQLSGASVDEHDAGAVVGTLTAFDPDEGDTLTFTVSDDRFEVVGDELKLKDGVELDFNEIELIDVTVTATDSHGESTSQSFSIDVNDVNEAPTDISLDNDTVAENDAGATVAWLAAADPDAGDTATFSIAEDASGLFEVVGNELKLKDGASLDREAQDAYEITLEVTDSGGANYTETVTINVADLNESPTDLQLSGDTVNENEAGAVVGEVSAYDPDDGDSLDFTVSDDRFEIVDGQLKLKDGVSLDHEAAETIDVTVTATDQGGLETSQSFTINVADVNEAPSDITLSGGTVRENSFEGTYVGTVSASDPDDGETFTFALADDADGRFAVDPDTGRITVADRIDQSILLDFEENPTHDIVVVVTDSAGNAYQETVTINVADLQNEYIIGDNADNVLTGAGGNDVIYDYFGGDDVLDGGDGNDVLVDIAGGEDELYGGAGDDILLGGAGADVIDGGDGTDTAYYSNSASGVSVDLESGGVNGSGGDAEGDEIVNVENVFGSARDDTIIGDDADNTLTGYYGDDVLQGGGGDDTIDGDYGRWGSAGDDTAVYSGAWSDYTITEENGVFTITDNRPDSPDGTDTVSNVENFQFADGVVTADNLLNVGPSDLWAEDATVAENSAAGTVAATLAVSDDNALDAHEFAITDDPSGFFEIVGNEVRVREGADLDYESQDSYDITVEVTDSAGASYTETVTINVADVNEAPVDFVLTPTSESGTLSLNQDGGNDDAAIAANMEGFPTTALTVEVTFTSSQTDVGSGVPLFSYAADSGSNNEALIWLESGSGNVQIYLAGQRINTGFSNADLLDGEEHQVSFTWDQASNELKFYVDGEEEFATSINIRDLRADGTVAFGQEQDAEGGGFDTNQIFEGEIAEARIFNYARSGEEIADNAGAPLDDPASEPGLVSNWLMNTNDGGFVRDAAGDNDLQLVNDASIEGGEAYDEPTVIENETGAVVGTLSATDPDSGEPVTNFAIADDPSGLFEVVGDELKLKDGVSLDHEAQDSYEITVEAIDDAGLATQQIVTINVADVGEAPINVSFDPAADSPVLSLNEDGGNNDYAIASNIEGFPTDALTVEVSFVSSQTDVGNGVPLFSYAANDGSNNEALIWLESGSGNVQIYLAGQRIDTGFSNADLLDGEPHQVAFSWDQSTNELKFYVDGEPAFETTVNIRDLRADGTLVLGQEQDTEGGAFDTNQIFEGQISEVRIFDYARSDQEIADNADAPFDDPETEPGLVNNWVMNGEEGGFIEDLVGANHMELRGDAGIIDGDFGSTPTVVENETGAIVGTISATDPQTGGPVTNFVIADDPSGLFELVGDQLKLKDGVSLDFETAETHDVAIEAIGSGGESTVHVVTINVADVDETNLILGTERADRLNGTDDADEIHGLGGNDQINGLGGDDIVLGGAGRDNVRGGDGDDVVEGGDGNDTIRGDAGADELRGGAGNDLIFADGDDTVVEGGEGTDRVIVQGDGDFSIDMTAGGVERVDGGAGNDVMDATGMSDRARQYGNAGDDTLIGGDNRDDQRGGAGNDIIDGGAGNDTIRGDAGADQLRGGAGNDLIFADSDDTVVEGGEGYDRVIVQGDGDFSIDMTAGGVERVDGGAGNDTMDATGMSDRVRQYGNDGDDTLIGGDNNDDQRGGAGNDVIDGGAGNDYIRGDAGADQLRGGAGNDRIYADSDDTVVEGGEGNDRVIVQGDGDFSIDMTAAGVERVDGGAGNDVMDATGMTDRARQYGNAGDDTLIGGEGRDVQLGGDGEDIIFGGGERDFIRGGDGNDALSGGEGADRIYGDAGDDTITGGTGNDRLEGGDGSDVFVYELGDGSDRISGGAGDWTDTIQLNAEDGSLGEFGVDWTIELTEGSIVSADEDGIVFTDDADGVITLNDGSTITFTDIEEVLI